jgi:hypothetical protein
MSHPKSPAEAVRNAKARYCRFIDTQQWEGFAGLLHPDIKVRMYNPQGATVAAFDTAETFVAATRVFLDGARSSHHLHNEEIHILAEEDLVVIADPKPQQPARMHGYGRYEETWRLGADGWRIARLALHRSILDLTPNPEA